ncbi:MAG: hypothetical protein WDN46_14760 [Methylocella sp.]
MRDRIKAEMKADIAKGYNLAGAKEEEMSAKYRASRDTCRQARDEIQSEFVEKETPTNSAN